MQFVAKAPDQAPRVVECGNDLKSLQELVGGYLEVVALPVRVNGQLQQLDLFLNEEGRLKGLAPNFILPGRGIIAGPVFVAARGGEYLDDTVGLDADQVAAVLELFRGLE